MILFKKWARNKVKSYIYVRPSFISLFATLTIEHKNSCGTKVLYLNCKTLFIIILLKSFMANFFFWDIVKILQAFHFEYFVNAWSCPSIMIVSPCRKIWCPKYWNQLVGSFGVYLHTKNQLHLKLLFEIL